MNRKITDLIGKRFGTLVVLEYAYKRKGRTYIKCVCDCGKISYKRTDVVEKSKHCPHQRFIDIEGQKFNMLTAIKPLGLGSNRHMKWLCKCDCGNEHIVSGYNLRKGRIKSCGCATKDFQSLASKIPKNGAFLNKMYFQYKYDATVRHTREFALSKQDFFSIIQEDCHYCGIDSHPFDDGRDNINGVDRLDSSLGYTKSNCVPCCSQCNIAKNTVSYDGFVDWIERVHSHLQKHHKITDRITLTNNIP